MNLKIKKEHFINLGLFIINLIVIYFAFGKLCQNTSCCHDTLPTVFSSPLGAIDVVNGYFLGSFLQNLFAKILPFCFKLHPQVFYQKFIPTFFFIIITIFVYSISWSLTYFSKDIKKINLSFLITLPFVITIFIKNDLIWIFGHDHCFYTYILNCIFGLLLYNLTELIYIKNISPLDTKEEKIKITPNLIVLFFILIFLLGISHEIIKLTYLGAIGFGAFLHHFINITNKKRNIYFVIAFALFIFFMFFNKILINYSLIKDIFIHNLEGFLYGIIIITLLCVAIFYFTKEEYSKKKIIISQISLLISLFIVNLYYTMIDASDIGTNFLNAIILLHSILILIGYLYIYSNNNKYNIVEYIAILLAFLIGFSFENISNNFKEKQEYYFRDNKIFLQNSYIAEKFYILNKQQNKTNYYYYKENDFVSKNAILYFINWYGDTVTSLNNVCKEEDSDLDCQKAMLDTVKKEVNYTFSKEELEHPDFQQFVKYWRKDFSVNKNQGFNKYKKFIGY